MHAVESRRHSAVRTLHHGASTLGEAHWSGRWSGIGVSGLRTLHHGRNSMALLAALALLAFLSGCSSLPLGVPRVPSHAIADGHLTALGRVFAAEAAQHPGLSGFQVVTSGHAAFVARAALADAAERTLDLQYYSVVDDLTTDLMLLRIVAAAERGVQVRILLDDIHAPTRIFARRAMAAHPDIQIRLFNPFLVADMSNLARLGELVFDGVRLNRRMHNKLWVTDNVLAISGSRNLGSEYFDTNPSANFSDVDMLAAGPVVTEMSLAFDAYWNSAMAVPMAALGAVPDAAEGFHVRQALLARTAACRGVPPCHWLEDRGLLDALRTGSVALSWARARFVYDQPEHDKSETVAEPRGDSNDGYPRASGARTELLIVSPYFVPDADERRHLADLRARRVRVAVLTNSLASTDSPAAHAGYARHRASMLRAGVELFELRPEPGTPHKLTHRWRQTSPSSLHAKFIVQDRARAQVGSMNQDPRSRLHNTEAWMVIDNVEIATELAALFEEGSNPQHGFRVGLTAAGDTSTLSWDTNEGGSTVRYGAEPMTGFWWRLWRDVLGALIPEHLL